MKKRSRELKKELQKAEWEETKIMWQHANWSWRVALIIGVITVVSWGYKLGTYIGTLIG